MGQTTKTKVATNRGIDIYFDSETRLFSCSIPVSAGHKLRTSKDYNHILQMIDIARENSYIPSHLLNKTWVAAGGYFKRCLSRLKLQNSTPTEWRGSNQYKLINEAQQSSWHYGNQLRSVDPDVLERYLQLWMDWERLSVEIEGMYRAIHKSPSLTQMMLEHNESLPKRDKNNDF